MAGTMNKRLNFDAMSIDEIWLLHETIIGILSARLTSEKRELEKKLAKLHRKKNVAPPAHNGQEKKSQRERRKYPQVFPKYQNPEEPSETWSGRGRQPRWLTAALRTGHKIEEFRIATHDEARKGLAVIGV